MPPVRYRLSFITPHSLRARPLLAISASLVLIIGVVAILAPWIVPFPGDAGTVTHPFSILHPPSLEHPFGTDQLGRDILSRVIFGTRISPLIAAVVVGSSLAIGVPVGVIAGYVGGAVDELLMRITDVFLAVPALLLALAFATVLPPGIGSTMIAIGVAWWPWYARLVRGQAASIRGRRYIESCRALGIPFWRVIIRHVIPNAITPVVVQASLDFSGVILTAAALAYLGLGVQDPTPDWGLMISEGQGYFPAQWWVVVFPGAAILITAVAFNLLGEGLKDLLDT